MGSKTSMEFHGIPCKKKKTSMEFHGIAWGYFTRGLGLTQSLTRAWVKRSPVQILVVVAIEMRTLKTEVEKGSM